MSYVPPRAGPNAGSECFCGSRMDKTIKLLRLGMVAMAKVMLRKTLANMTKKTGNKMPTMLLRGGRSYCEIQMERITSATRASSIPSCAWRGITRKCRRFLLQSFMLPQCNTLCTQNTVGSCIRGACPASMLQSLMGKVGRLAQGSGTAAQLRGFAKTVATASAGQSLGFPSGAWQISCGVAGSILGTNISRMQWKCF